MHWRSVGGWLLALVCLQAQTKPGTVEGMVVNSVTRAPIPRATVSVANGQTYSRVGVTDESGNFQIANVEPGSYRVEYVHAPSYLYEPPRAPAITVAADQHVKGLVLEMTPLGVIAGKVTDNDGEPLQGAQVAIMGYRYRADGSKSLGTFDGAVTDDRGQYRVFHLKPGRYYVNAWLPPGQVHDGMFQSDWLPANAHRTTPQLGYMPVFYPNGADVSQASAVPLAAGAEATGINFQLRAVPVYHIRGRVSGFSKADPRTSVLASPCPAPEGAAEYGAKVQAEGGFDLSGVGAGVYCLTLTQGDSTRTLYANDTVTLTDRSLDSVTVQGMPAFSVPGTVRVDGAPIDLSENVVNANPVSRASGSRNSALIEDGKFTLLGTVPGVYHVSPNANRLLPNLYLKSMVYGNRDVSDGVVDLQPGGGVLTLVFGDNAGQLAGTVQDENGEPAAGVEVSVMPADVRLAGRGDLSRWARTDASGHFQEGSLAPGDYQIWAWGDSDVPMALSAEFRKEFAGRAASVTLAAGTKATVQVKLIPAEEIRKVKGRY